MCIRDSRPTGRGPAPVVHHRPPHPDQHRPGRDRLAARTHPGRRPPPGPGRDRHRPRQHRPTSSPRPQDQVQAGVLARPTRHHHPHRTRCRARLRHHRGLTPAPSRPPTGTSPRAGPRRTRPDSRAAAMHPNRNHSPYTPRRSTTRGPPHRELPHLPGIGRYSHDYYWHSVTIGLAPLR